MIYILNKKYPGLPKDWEIGMEFGLGDSTYNYSPCNGKYLSFYISKEIIENNNEFFVLKIRDLVEIEKEIKKHSEILSLLKEEESNHYLEFNMSFDNSYMENFDDFNKNVQIDFSYPVQEMRGHVGSCTFKTLKKEYKTIEDFKNKVKESYSKNKQYEK